MRLSLRFVLPLLLAIGLVAYAVRPLVDQLTLKWFVRDLDIRAMLIANTVQEPLVELVARQRAAEDRRHYFNRIAEDERLYALGFCDAQRRPAHRHAQRSRPTSGATASIASPTASTHLLASAKGPLHVVVENRARGQRDARQARDRPRHELRHAAQRGNQALRLLVPGRAGRAGVAHHGGHRPAELARLGAGDASAAARRGAAAPRDSASRCPSCGRSRATCAR